MRPEGVVADLAAVGFGKVREKGANAGVERHYAITAWGLNVALRRVRNDEPVQAAFLHQSAFFVLRRNGFGHPQRSENGVIDAVLRHGVVWYVAGLLGVLAAAVAELGELFVMALLPCAWWDLSSRLKVLTLLMARQASLTAVRFTW